MQDLVLCFIQSISKVLELSNKSVFWHIPHQHLMVELLLVAEDVQVSTRSTHEP